MEMRLASLVCPAAVIVCALLRPCAYYCCCLCPCACSFDYWSCCCHVGYAFEWCCSHAAVIYSLDAAIVRALLIVRLAVTDRAGVFSSRRGPHMAHTRPIRGPYGAQTGPIGNLHYFRVAIKSNSSIYIILPPWSPCCCQHSVNLQWAPYGPRMGPVRASCGPRTGLVRIQSIDF